jgi:hypothetical protein
MLVRICSYILGHVRPGIAMLSHFRPGWDMLRLVR